MFGKYITLHKLRNIILGGFEEGWESFREREVRAPCFSRTLFVGGGGGDGTDKLRVKYQIWLFHTHTLSLSHLLAYIFKGHDGLRLEREMLCNMIGGGGG